MEGMEVEDFPSMFALLCKGESSLSNPTMYGVYGPGRLRFGIPGRCPLNVWGCVITASPTGGGRFTPGSCGDVFVQVPLPYFFLYNGFELSAIFRFVAHLLMIVAIQFVVMLMEWRKAVLRTWRAGCNCGSAPRGVADPSLGRDLSAVGDSDPLIFLFPSQPDWAKTA
ncbi:hypothetical protein ACLOJK_036740 [Asimina triloba]